MATITVGISDLKLASSPDILATFALGSCVGICLLDPALKLGGLSHIMLPSQAVSPHDKNVYKFADTAIPQLVSQMVARGANRARITAKIAGGAQMFTVNDPAHANDAIWQIGQRNVNAVVELLGRLRIPIVARDVLKNYGRTVFFDPANGDMTIKALNHGLKVL